VIQTETKL